MHAGLLALAHELGNELAHALVAPDEDRGVVVVADALVLHHVLEVADDGRGVQVMPAGGDQRLVHVQGDGTGGTHSTEGHTPVVTVQIPAATAGHRLSNLALGTGNVRETIDVFG